MGDTTEIKRLVENFREQIESYKKGKYNETQLRREYLDPFFAALGWDIENKDGYAEAYKDVVHEDAIKVGGATKAPDYSFRVGGVRKFFVEAKKPSVNIKDDTSPAYQLRRYAWSAKLPISILTDFEEFAVYDCRKTPKPKDKASTGRIFYTTYDKFLEQWDEIAGIFSREAILKGAFDKYADSKKTRGTAEVDDEFLKEMESWREALAKNIAFKNSGLSIRELNHAVQLTIDRIVFLRICEDRGIEPYGKLQALLNGKNVYERLTQLFMQADDKYNSGLFHFTKEKDRPGEPDSLTPSLEITDTKLKDIIKRLYYPDSPYEFSVISGDILGQVYERFLGKVIVPKGRGVEIEEKPEVRKAGGVYYTPTYIVDYIVKNTVGKLVEGKTPKKVEKLRILDPACGSGSFLLGAYQFLLDWHRDWYASNEPKKHAKGKQPKVFLFRENDWRLTTSEKKRILLNNIYGVDIDTQAVEVTKLSLLLKVLEGESEETLLKQFQLFKERALPDLRANIKCGNSLIGPDFYEGKDLSLFGEDEQYRINVFDWESEFKDVFKQGGFDAVIGNPPYVRIQAMKEWAPVEVEFYKEKYYSASKGNYDIYVVFVEKGLKLLNKDALMGFILPSKFFSTDYGKELRSLIDNRKALVEIVDFGHEQVFAKATTYTCLLFLTGGASKLISYSAITPLALISNTTTEQQIIRSENLNSDSWLFQTDEENDLISKLLSNSLQLNDLPSRIGRGSSSGADDVFVIKVSNGGYVSRQGESVEIEDEILHIPIYATDFGRWHFTPKAQERIIFPYEVTGEGYKLIQEKDMRERFPKTYKYLLSRKDELLRRKQFKAWWGFSAPRNLDVHANAQMLVPLLADKGKYCSLPGHKEQYCLMASGGFSITIDSLSRVSPYYIQGLLNSKLLFWRLRTTSNKFRGGWITCTKQYVGKLPIYNINFDNPDDVAKHDRMVELVETMLELNKKLPKAKTDHNKNLIQRQIDYTDSEIDKLVYKLYGLTDDEIKIVEGEV